MIKPGGYVKVFHGYVRVQGGVLVGIRIILNQKAGTGPEAAADCRSPRA